MRARRGGHHEQSGSAKQQEAGWKIHLSLCRNFQALSE